MSKVDGFADLNTGIRLCYRTTGSPVDTPIVLIGGLGVDLTWWPSGMVSDLSGQGHFVVQFDNRDVGRSTTIGTPPPGMLRQLAARPRRDAYSLVDMASDALGLLDYLGTKRAHLVGMSMGGMIAQTVAAQYPARVASLTSIFSTTGARHVGQPAASTILLLARPRALTKSRAVARHVALVRHVGDSRYPHEDAAERDYAASMWERGPGIDAWQGVARQISAIQRSADRTAELARITAPTLVIHGDRDRMVAPSGGRATAAAIRGARHITIPGLGHRFPPALVPTLTRLIGDHVRSATVM